MVITLKFIDGSVGSLTYSGSGYKAYSRETLEIFFDGKTISSRDFRVSELHGTGKTKVAFKTRGQEMGYTLRNLQAFCQVAFPEKRHCLSIQMKCLAQ